MSILRILGVVSFVAISLVNSNAQAITISTIFSGGSAPGNITGGGDIEDLFNLAARTWENKIEDSHDYEIIFRWRPIGGSTFAFSSILSAQNDEPPFDRGVVTFDSDGTTNWFLDSTPLEGSEYLNQEISFADFGGGEVNVGNVFRQGTGDALAAVDLFSLALHEIGHILGVIDLRRFFGQAQFPQVIVVGDDLPNTGTNIATTIVGGGHINNGPFPDALMVAIPRRGDRKLISDIDILAVAELSGFSNVNLFNTVTSNVPEPSTLALFGFGLVGLGVMRRRRN